MVIDIIKKCQKSCMWMFFFKKILKFDFQIIFEPKIFLKKLNYVEVDIKDIYNYSQNIPKTKWDMGNSAYQSNHDLQKNDKFSKIKYQIENVLNEEVKHYFYPTTTFGRFKIKSIKYY